MLDIFFADNNYAKRQLSERTKKGWLLQLKKWVYLINKDTNKSVSLFYVANILVEPSFVSKESALAYRGIIPEASFTITSLTTKNTKKFITPLWKFSFQHCQRKSFTGFEQKVQLWNKFFIATPEKALVDFLYYQMSCIHDTSLVIDQFRLQSLSILNIKKLLDYAQVYNKKKLHTIIECIIKTILSDIYADDWYSSL